MEEIKLEIKDGALFEVPIYEENKRGKNWMAIITPDPKSPGGLARKFCNKANGVYYYMIDGLEVGNAVEFGADYYTGSGRKQAGRWYGIIKTITDDEMILIHCSNSSEAIKISKEFVITLDKDELIKEKDKLLKRIEEIDKLLKEGE